MKKRFLLLFLCIFLMACGVLARTTPLPEIPFPTRPAVSAEPQTPVGTLAPKSMPVPTFSPILFRLEGNFGPSFALLGGVQTGTWISPELTAGQMTQHQFFDFYSPIGKSGRAGGDVSYAEMPSSCAGYSVKTDLAGYTDNLIGVAEGWPVMTRPEKEFPVNTLVYRRALSDWLVGQGLDQPVIQISRILRVDLEGDGVDEVFVVASHFKDPSGHMAEYGDYSLVLMRKVISGGVVTSPLVADLYRSKDPELVFPNTYELVHIMDLNRDAKLEAIVTVRFWEGFGAQVYEINGAKPAEVLKYKCGG